MLPITHTIEQLRDIVQGLRLLLISRLKAYRAHNCQNVELAEEICRNEQELVRLETILHEAQAEILTIGEIEGELRGQTERD